MTQPPREAFTTELETADDDPNKVIREIMLSITTANSSYAGTDARVYFQIGDRTFLLDNSIGAEVSDKNITPQKVTTHSSVEVSFGGITLSTNDIKKANRLSAYSVSELPEGVVELALGKIRRDDFEKGQTDVFFLKGQDGSLGITLEAFRYAALKLSHDTSGLTSDWHVSQIELMVSYTDKDAYQYYKKWHAVGWLKDKSPELLLQASLR
jgi:hypothetical protein